MNRLFILAILYTFLSCLPSLAILPPRTEGKSVDNAQQIVHRAEEKTRAKEWKEAVELWKQAVDTNPLNGAYWDQLGLAHYSAKDYASAIKAYEKVLEYGEGYPFNAAYNIACCNALMGNKEASLEWVERALDMGLRDLHQVQTDTDLNVLHGNARFTKLAALADVSKMSRIEGWRYDLWLLAREAKRIHYKPLRGSIEPTVDAFVKKLNDGIPHLTDNQITVRCMQLMKLFGDGHTSMRPGMQSKALPVQFYLFSEGLYIIAASPAHAELAGMQVLRIGDHSVDDVMKSLDTVISQDNTIWPRYIGPNYMRRPEILNGLGLIPDADRVTLTLRGKDGAEQTVSLMADAAGQGDDWKTAESNTPGPTPLYLKNRKAPYWFEYLPAAKTVYFQYNAVQNAPTEPLDKFCDRLFKFIDGNDVERLVIDMRWNGGGNNFLNVPLTHGLIRCDKINQSGKLFVIVGRNTFSAAMCGATHIELHTHAIFVGEPTGSRPNFVGETIMVNLPYSKMRASISDLYWQNSIAMDYRTWIAPTLYAPPTFELYRAKRDPAMEAIMEYKMIEGVNL